MGKQADREQFLNDCAKTIMGQLRLDATRYHQSIYSCASHIQQSLPAEWRDRVTSYIARQPDEYIGKLGSVNPSSRAQIVGIAALHVMGAIAGRIWNERKKVEAEEAGQNSIPKPLVCKFCQWTTASSMWTSLPGVGRLDEWQKLTLHIGKEHEEEAKRLQYPVTHPSEPSGWNPGGPEGDFKRPGSPKNQSDQ